MQRIIRSCSRLTVGSSVIGLCLIGSATATVVGGGGARSTDCLAVFDAEVSVPPANPRHVKCVDGAACDKDMAVNGSCTIPLVVCANSAAISGCTMAGVNSITVDHAMDNGDPKFDPDFQALQTRIDNDIMLPDSASKCADPSNIHVAIKGPYGSSCRPNTKKVKVTTVSSVMAGHFYTDTDVIKFTCVPADDTVGGCDPMTLYDDTFDRIQTQVFKQSCAVSSCHDAAASGGLVLESGASYTNLLGADPLVGVDPSNSAAKNAGWKRVKVSDTDMDTVPDTGDPNTSFIYHKLQHDLPDASYGSDMPLNKPKLNAKLRELIANWIIGGAPDSDANHIWVPGTF